MQKFIHSNRRIVILCFLVWGTMLTTHAQVTIGSGNAPQAGALLDLKETDNLEDNSTKGVIYPRVALIKADELYPMYGNPGDESTVYTTDKANLKKSHTGLVVFNTTDNPIPGLDKDVFTSGLYIWDGSFWKRIDNRLVVVPEIQELKCASAVLSPAHYTLGILYSGTLTIPYIGGNGGEYSSHTITTANGLTATLQPGNLAIGNGSLYYSVEGIPIESSPVTTEFVIDDFLGQSCSAIVGDKDEVKAMEYAKLYITPLPKAEDPPYPAGGFNTIYTPYVRFGNIKVRYLETHYRAFLGGVDITEYIQFAPVETTNITYSYTKHGSGGVNYAVYGQALLKADQFITPEGKEVNAAGDRLDLIGNQNVTSNNNEAYNINSNNRDLATLMVIFHNTGEIYRINFNINGFISGSGLTTDIDPSIGIFVEKLE